MSFLIRLTHFLQKHARLCLFIVVAFLAFCFVWALRFQIDASAETLLNKKDRDYAISQRIDRQYQLNPVLAFVYQPKATPFSPQGIHQISQLKRDLLAVKGVVRVTTLVDAPLFNQPRTVVPPPGSNVTLLTPGVDIELAKSELMGSPLYRDLLISKDGSTMGIDVQVDPRYLSTVKTKHILMKELRGVVTQYRVYGNSFLGGLEVIADDMISYINRDLVLFGSLIFISIILILALIFRRVRWVFLTVGCCVAALISMTGFLGLFGWKVTVVSSNFISLQIIFTMDRIIHLVTRYEELLLLYPDESPDQIMVRTIESKFVACFFADFTTIIGFASLLASGITPVIAFGLMMIMGISLSFVLTMVLFITVLSILPRITENTRSVRKLPVRSVARFTDRYRGAVLVFGAVILIWGIVGMSKLEVENSFINYFKKSTELRRGLEFLDNHLGGTTPLTITIDVSNLSQAQQAPPPALATSHDALFDDFSDVTAKQAAGNPKALTLEKVQIAKKVQEYLESQPSVGKVTSIWTTVQMAETITKGPIGDFELAVLKNTLPPSLKTQLLDSFYSEDRQELRITLRLLDSDPKLRRNVFLKQIRYDLEHQLGLAHDQFQLSGAMVLYNNILQKLFDSQILTLGSSTLILVIVLFLWLRNFGLAVILLVPNLFSVTAVLGFMGWFHIPLDMMTITIASISVGIAVNNAIYYVYQYRREFLIDHEPVGAMFRTHSSVGTAITFSTLTTCFGFGVLVFSNFIPNIMFGVLTIVALGVALLSTLTVMPLCLLIYNSIKWPVINSSN